MTRRATHLVCLIATNTLLVGVCVPALAQGSRRGGGGTIRGGLKTPAPNNLSAQGHWSDSCCNGASMAHITLKWNPVFGVRYNVYRVGTGKVASNLQTVTWDDMGVPSGETRTYYVTAVGVLGESAASLRATATAPYPPDNANSAFLPPTNLRVSGLWNTSVKQETDKLTWDPVPGAVSYNLYRYEKRIASGITSATYTVPPANWEGGLTYTVTAVDSMGMESIPSSLAGAVGAHNPSETPDWVPARPLKPRNISIIGEWNAGKPRVRVTWHSGGEVDGERYVIYRDGVRVAEGIWGLYWLDTNVVPGEQHTYSVQAFTFAGSTVQNGPMSTPIVGVAPFAAPFGPDVTGATVKITRIVSNDDSVMIYFDPVPGAVEYRCYKTTAPGSIKYSGGNLSLEMNGLDPVAPTSLVVEAVDKLGPFQLMDGVMGPGSMMMGGMMNVAINGQGDPTNVPNILARSAAFNATCTPFALTGAQAFFDNFRNSQPFIHSTTPIHSAIAAANETSTDPFNGRVEFYENDKWNIGYYHTDMLNTKIFVMGNHFMDTMYDGGTPGSGIPLHVTDASLTMTPKAVADITGGKTLHVTFEMDGHMGNRRWCDISLSPAGEPLIRPGLLDGKHPTPSGKLFRWEVTRGSHTAQILTKSGSGGSVVKELINRDMWENEVAAARVRWDGVPLSNGTAANLDRRHRYDLYVSETRFRMIEDGKVIFDSVYPNGMRLPFTRMNVNFVHQLYHTELDRMELINSSPEDSYWYNYRPFSDERHWDNMGFEVLNTFPQ